MVWWILLICPSATLLPKPAWLISLLASFCSDKSGEGMSTMYSYSLSGCLYIHSFCCCFLVHLFEFCFSASVLFYGIGEGVWGWLYFFGTRVQGVYNHSFYISLFLSLFTSKDGLGITATKIHRLLYIFFPSLPFVSLSLQSFVASFVIICRSSSRRAETGRHFDVVCGCESLACNLLLSGVYLAFGSFFFLLSRVESGRYNERMYQMVVWASYAEQVFSCFA